MNCNLVWTSSTLLPGNACHGLKHPSVTEIEKHNIHFQWFSQHLWYHLQYAVCKEELNLGLQILTSPSDTSVDEGYMESSEKAYIKGKAQRLFQRSAVIYNTSTYYRKLPHYWIKV